MKIQKFKTNLRCESCLSKIGPFFDQDKTIEKWSVDLKDPGRILSVSGNNVDSSKIKAILTQEGYQAVEYEDIDTQTEPSVATYFPLILILAYLLGGIGVFQLQAPFFNLKEAMAQFMGGFFVIFSFFKILNLKGFAEAYSTYDLIAKKWALYGYTYPFIELGLGVAYWAHAPEKLVNMMTIAVMGLSSLGVIRALIDKKKIRCACLGTVFNLPMTSVTLLEDLLMVGMALGMLVLGS